MQRSSVGIVIVCWTLLGLALAAAQQPLSPGETVRVGRHYFVRYCSACHGVEGRGDGPAALALQPPPADLTRIAQRRGGRLARLRRRRAKPFPVAEMTAYIDGRTVVPAHGRRDMPIWGERFGEGGALSCAPSADAVAGNGRVKLGVGRKRKWPPDTLRRRSRGGIVGRDELGEAVVRSHLRFLIAYLQAIQQ